MRSSFEVVFFLPLIIHFYTHAVRQIDAADEELITAFANQAKTVSIPFQKCLKA
jgi:hypothetical protein